MNTFDRYWRTIPTRNGILLFVALAAYFLIMRALGLAHNLYLRAGNLIWLYLALRATVMQYHRQANGSYYEDFFDYFKISMRTAFIGTALFSAFLAIYLDQIDPGFMQILQQDRNFGGHISPVSVAVLIFIEGISSSLVVSFLYIQMKKYKTVEGPSTDRETLVKKAK